MKWYGITGSWRKTNFQVEQDVRQAVKEVMQRGDGIIAGGALNVDWFAVDEALKYSKDGNQIRVFIPANLQRYVSHYRKRADQGVITHHQAEQLIKQLNTLNNVNPDCLIELEDGRPIDKESYYDRNSRVVEESDVLLAFQVNNSQGTQDTINKAKSQGIPVTVNIYTI